MAIVGRKPVDLTTLIFFEFQWWALFSRMRDGISGREVDAGWQLPEDFKFRQAPANIKHPGILYEFHRDEQRRMMAAFQPVTRTIPPKAGEPRIWAAMKGAIADKNARKLRKALSESRYFNPAYKIPIETWKSGNVCKDVKVVAKDRVAVTVRAGAARSEVQLLYENATRVIEACSDSRYPSKASTRDNERMLYLARVMAGISCRVPPATAVDKLRKLKHGKVRTCRCMDCSNIKRELLQWVLYDLSEKTSSVPIQLLNRLDENCRCAHCFIVNRLKMIRKITYDKPQ